MRLRVPLWDPDRQRLVRALLARHVPLRVLVITPADGPLAPGVMSGRQGHFHVLPVHQVAGKAGRLMKTPPGLMAAALLFWGWQSGLWFLGLLLAAAIEAARFTRARWEFTDADLNRICDLCWLLVLAAGLLLYSADERLLFIYQV